jgi:hypothetical protein
MTEAEYNQAPGARSTVLKALAKTLDPDGPSPAHARVESEAEATDAMAFGTALHAALSTPEVFAATYRVRAPYEGKGAKERRAIEDATKGVSWLKAEDMARLSKMADACRRHNVLGPWLAAKSHVEEAIFWTETIEVDGKLVHIPCKVRLDFAVPVDGGVLVVDLKSTVDASPRKWEQQAQKLRYDVQAFHYLRGAESADIDVANIPLAGQSPAPAFVFAAIEKDAPFGVTLHACTQAAIDVAAADWRDALKKWHDCSTTGNWPNFDEGELTAPKIHPMSYPSWRRFVNTVDLERFIGTR